MTDSLAVPPEGYEAFLLDLKQRIREAQVRAALAVNRELVLLYWGIGRETLARQQQQGWGARVIDRLAADLRHAFPEMSGFSPRNLKYMRSFAAAWPDEAFVQQVAAPMPWRRTELTVSLPEELRGNLPTIEALEEELSQVTPEDDAQVQETASPHKKREQP
jgi:hypothetical protein